MERPLHDSRLPRPASPSSGAAAVIVWSILSLIPLLLAALRIPLWATVSPPIEQYALPMTLITQVAITALLFPWLMRDRRASVFLALGSALLLQLSGLLGDEPWMQIAQAMLWLWIWLAALLLLAGILRSPAAQQVAVALTTTAGIGGMILLYLRAEFAAGGEVEQEAILWLIPAGMLMGSAISYLLYSRQPFHR